MKTAFLQDAPSVAASGLGWAGLSGDALAFVLTRGADSSRLVVVDETDAAERLVRALRFFSDRPEQIVLFGADDVRPYDGFSPSAEIPRGRLRVLDRLEAGEVLTVVAPVRALMTHVPVRSVREAGTRSVAVGDVLDRDALREALTDGGYLLAQRVTMEASYAVRGDVVDVWPAGGDRPVRIDFFDDEIEGLDWMDPSTNRTEGSAGRIRLLPAREDRIDVDAVRRLGRETNRLVADQRRGHLLRRRVIEELRAGIRFSGIEDWMPALVETLPALACFEGLRPIVVLPDDVGASAREFARSARERWAVLDDEERPLVPPEERYAPVEETLAQLSEGQLVHDLAVDSDAVDLGARSVEGLAVRGSELGPVVSKLKKLALEGARVGLVVASERRAEALMTLLEPHGLYPRRVGHPDALRAEEVGLLVGDLPLGFSAPESGWVVVPAGAIFGGRRRSRKIDRIHAFFDSGVTSVNQLKEGDHIVHKLHGVGIFRGLIRVAVQGIGDFRARQQQAEQDCLKLEYRGGDTLYLPATRLRELSRYVPAKTVSKVVLDRLGGQTWTARKAKVRDSILQMAQALLATQAKRELAQRAPLPEPGVDYRRFEDAFPYEETPDQAAAIEAVQDDLSKAVPMDRLICGDVGFGKTEVAMRAAMRVVEAGHQVAVLCPTTVLAYQHARTFMARFEGMSVKVGMLSRFSSAAEQKEVKAGLRDGSIQIVVGTTALLGRGVRYADLALVVVDEEHRFGVRQKERFKKMRSEVHILSMSATPIPRTLQMGLSGIREMSLITTPPADRLAVRTSIARFARARVSDAIRQELARGGQVFFVHNRVETIDKIAERLTEWVPEARFAVAHGKMDASSLEDVLVRFIQRETDVLVCTALMESGIDLENVNTMLVNRADMFGLAQLYQLRGRVGRSSIRASCTLLVPEDITREARRRMQVLVDNTSLGAGFQVAAADLELRGAGNLVGNAQSGNIDAVGYEVWLEMLEHAVSEAKGNLARSRIDPEVEVPVAAFLPEKLIPDLQERLALYRRFSGADSVQVVDRLVSELEGRSDEDLPEPVYNLAGLAQAQVWCRDLGIAKASWLKVRVVFELHERTVLEAGRLEGLKRRMPKRLGVRSTSDGRTLIEARFTPKEGEHPFRFLRWLFTQLSRTD